MYVEIRELAETVLFAESIEGKLFTGETLSDQQPNTNLGGLGGLGGQPGFHNIGNMYTNMNFHSQNRKDRQTRYRHNT